MATAPRLLSCWVRFGPSAAIVRARGEADLSSSEILRRCIFRAFRRPLPVIVDLTEVTYINGSGLRILEEAASHSAGLGRAFLVVPSPRVRRLLMSLNVHTVPLAASLEDALDRVTPAD